MATVPVQSSPSVVPPRNLEPHFRRLEAEWKRDTEFLSDAGKILGHPAVQAIVDLGDPVVPLMLHDLETKASLWVWVLPRITGENPVPAASAGNVGLMRDAWLTWGRAKGIR